MEIREADIHDLEKLKQIEQAIILYERQFAHNLKADPIEYYNLKELMLSEHANVVVAVINNEIIGTAYALIKSSKPYQTTDQYAYLGFMYVSPDFRGKGINGLIIDALIHWSKQKGITEFQLDVYIDNKSAIDAYTKRNFKPNLLNMRMNIDDE